MSQLKLTDFENMSTFTPAALREPLPDTIFARLESWPQAMEAVRHPAN